MKTYTIKKANAPITEESFAHANIAKVDCSPWPDTLCPFTVEARLLYDDEAIYVNMACDEHPVTAVHTERDSSVCCDSCMEFFLAPNADDASYINIEINAIGTMLLHQGYDRHNNKKLPVADEIFDIKTVITQKGWQLFYKVPFSFLTEYFGKVTDTMHGNFYKCGDETPHMHYAMWSPIDLPEPDYHRPEFFGEIILEK